MKDKDPKEKAKEFVDMFYYMLPNNGYLDFGINSCDSRYKEAIKCARKCVKEIIKALDFNKENQFIIENYWKIVEKELEENFDL